MVTIIVIITFRKKQQFTFAGSDCTIFIYNQYFNTLRECLAFLEVQSIAVHIDLLFSFISRHLTLISCDVILLFLIKYSILSRRSLVGSVLDY